jgi:FSR family fosmidomycin resistance protein-like MFS transporter
LLRDRSFLSASLAHFSVDLLNSQRPLLLAALSVPLGLTNSLIGLVSMLYTLAGSVSQPIFGMLSDRFGARRLAAIGVVWLALFFGVAVTSAGPTALVLLVLAAFGSGAFHPAGTVEASEVGRLHVAGQQATAAALFILFGQAGYSLGPALGGAVMEGWGPAGLLVFLPLALPAGLAVARNFSLPTMDAGAALPAGRDRVLSQAGWGALAALAGMAALRSWVQTNMITFLPKYYSDLGFSPAYYGIIAALFMGGSAVGGVAGGWLGDRTSQRVVTIASLVAAAAPLALFPALSGSPWAFLLSAAAGALTGASNGIMVILGQRMMPGRLGAVSGLVLGFSFAAGSVGTLLSGFQADRAGFDAVFLTSAGISALAGILAFGIRDRPGESARPPAPLLKR